MNNFYKIRSYRYFQFCSSKKNVRYIEKSAWPVGNTANQTSLTKSPTNRGDSAEVAGPSGGLVYE